MDIVHCDVQNLWTVVCNHSAMETNRFLHVFRKKKGSLF
jgi:hypothetical protein